MAAHNYPVHRNVVINPLTDRRREVLTTIHRFLAQHQYAPTLRELAAALGWQAHSSIGHNLRVLKQSGYLNYSCDPRGVMLSRTLSLTDTGLAQVQAEQSK